MRTFLKAMILTTSFFSLISCSNSQLDGHSTEHNYNEIEHLKIEWKEVFFQAETHYFVYFYSPNCGHCEAIKNKVIDFALNSEEKMYFIQFNDEIKILTDVKETIGVTSIENFGILGTPSLVELEDKKITSNIAGASDILLFLDIPTD